MTKSSELLTTAQAAERLGLSLRRVQDLVADGTLPHTRVGARTILIAAGDLAKAKGRPGRGRPKKAE